VTLINLHVGPDSAMIVSDSLATNRGRPACFQPKVILFPHAAMMLTGRGADDCCWRAYWDLSHRYFAGGIDGAESILSGLLEDAQLEMQDRYPHATGLRTEVAVVGYSPREQRYRAVMFQSKNGFEPEDLGPGIYMSPSDGRYKPSRMAAPTDQMWVSVAIEQMRQLQAEQPPGSWASVGGDLFKFELTKTGFAVRKLCRLPLYDEILSEIQRGFDPSRSGDDAQDTRSGERDPTRPELVVS
jgi:hypothetical protein